MKWLLKLIPLNSIIIYLCSYLKSHWTSKTKTTIDDNAVDKILQPLLLIASELATDPNFSWEDFGIKGGYLIIDFLGEDGISQLYGYIDEKKRQFATVKQDGVTLKYVETHVEKQEAKKSAE